MPKDQFAHEAPIVARLLDWLWIEPDGQLANPNLDGESGADVLARISGRRIGVQVTQIDNAYSLPDVSAEPITGRGAEKAIAREREQRPYGGFAENDPAKIVANVAAAIRRKALHRVTGFDELWLIVAAGVPETGGVISTFLMTPWLLPGDLDAATHRDLMQSSHDRAFILPILGVERALYQWAKPSGPWTKRVERDPLASWSLEKLQAFARTNTPG